MFQKYVFGISFLLRQGQGFLIEIIIEITVIAVTLLANIPRKVIKTSFIWYSSGKFKFGQKS